MIFDKKLFFIFVPENSPHLHWRVPQYLTALVAHGEEEGWGKGKVVLSKEISRIVRVFQMLFNKKVLQLLKFYYVSAMAFITFDILI